MPRPDVSEERRLQIVAAAIQVFVRKGYRKTTMPEIARQAGLSIGGVYWYFKSKDEIVQAILEDIFQKDLTALRLLLDEDSSAAERMKSFVAAYIESYNSVSWMNSIGLEFFGEAAHDPNVQGFIQNYLARYRQVLVQLIEQGIRRGEFRPVNPVDTANAVLALEEGLSLLVVADPQFIRWTESFQLAISLILDGITRPVPQDKGKDE